jgi:hypothetical protein
MFRWLRARAAWVAPAVLVALLALALPHGGGAHHDADGALGVAVAHDASAHAIGRGAQSDERPEHCAICHWSRTFHSLTKVRVLAVSMVEARKPVRPDVHTAAGRTIAAQPPLRAPPVPLAA